MPRILLHLLLIAGLLFNPMTAALAGAQMPATAMTQADVPACHEAAPQAPAAPAENSHHDDCEDGCRGLCAMHCAGLSLAPAVTPAASPLRAPDPAFVLPQLARADAAVNRELRPPIR